MSEEELLIISFAMLESCKHFNVFKNITKQTDKLVEQFSKENERVNNN
jgi:hypothetical protein